MKKALVYAAGRGERLRPLTDSIPKPLCELNHKAVIAYQIEALARADFKEIFINHAYLGWKIRQYLGNGAHFGVDINYIPEPPGALETGGALYSMKKYLHHQPFLVVSADIFTDFNYNEIQPPHDQVVNLVLIKNPDFKKEGDFGLNDGYVTQSNKEYTFANIAYYHPDIYQYLKPGRYPIGPILKKLCQAGMIKGQVYNGEWADIGHIDRLRHVNSSFAKI
jgi:MurNAc alpha-1-phosphate uridylyltransferase